MSEIKVNSIKGVGSTDAAITINNSDGTCTANITNNLSNRNLIINGAMQVAQRGLSSTSSGHQTIDRFSVGLNQNDENPTQAQVDVASGTTPYTLGFRKAFKLTNGNQTSGAGGVDRINIIHRIEAQDIANSGWNYTSSSSFITLSFWVKSSVAQNFFGHIKTSDGTAYNYPFETGSLSADTWTKITKKIQGNSNLQFDNDTEEGLRISWFQFAGTSNTGSNATLNQWAAYDSAERMPDFTSTWYTTNDATFELTGVQLEVSDHATDFEHKSFAQELQLCKRYFEKITLADYPMQPNGYNGINSMTFVPYSVEKRASATVTADGSFNFWRDGHNVGTSPSFGGNVYGATIFAGLSGANYGTSSMVRSGTFLASSEL